MEPDLKVQSRNEPCRKFLGDSFFRSGKLLGAYSLRAHSLQSIDIPTSQLLESNVRFSSVAYSRCFLSSLNYPRRELAFFLFRSRARFTDDTMNEVIGFARKFTPKLFGLEELEGSIRMKSRGTSLELYHLNRDIVNYLAKCRGRESFDLLLLRDFIVFFWL